MKKAIFIKFIILSLLLTGCEKNVSIDKMPAFVPKLVIGGFISPDDITSYISVSVNQNIYGEIRNDNTPGNFKGWLSDGDSEIELDTIRGMLFFGRDDMRLIPGKNYHIRVESDKGIRAESTCTIPEQHDFSIKADTFSILHQMTGYRSWREKFAKFSFTDQGDRNNYYRIDAMFLRYISYNNKVIKSYEPAMFDQPGPVVFTDYITGKAGYIEKTIGYRNIMADSIFLVFRLMNTEKSYYLYHNSLWGYEGGSDPFTESRPVYSNIDGGLGIFTSYTVDSLVIRLM